MVAGCPAGNGNCRRDDRNGLLRLISVGADDGGTGGVYGRRKFVPDRVQLGLEVAETRRPGATRLEEVDPLSALLELVEQRGDAALVAPARLRDVDCHVRRPPPEALVRTAPAPAPLLHLPRRRAEQGRRQRLRRREAEP